MNPPHGFAKGKTIPAIIDSNRHNPYRAIHKIFDLIQIGTMKNGKQALHH